jgi:hypothetical protein
MKKYKILKRAYSPMMSQYGLIICAADRCREMSWSYSSKQMPDMPAKMAA